MKSEKRKYFLTGLLVVLPALVTLYLFISLFAFFDNIIGRYISRITLHYLGYKIPGLGLLLFIVLIFVTGFFATNFIGKRFLRFLEQFFLKFPFIKKIYPAIKQITEFLFSQKIEGHLQKVVLVEYPRKGIYIIGFVTNRAPEELSRKIGQELLNVLIPSVPNPITGFVICFPKSEVIVLDMSIEDGVKLIVSGGVYNPKDLPKVSSEHSA
jgi:uncharacterized membrane protein